MEQWLSYQKLTNHIGKHAYADTYALRMIGKPGDYLGVIEGVRWNALPTSKEDVQGWQPRYLIARETVKGSTEKRWYCTYLIKPDDTPPEKYKPRPFPAYRNLREK